MDFKVSKWFLVLFVMAGVVHFNGKCEASLQFQTGSLTFKEDTEVSLNVTEKKQALKADSSKSNKPKVQSTPVVADQRHYQVIFNHILSTSSYLGPDRAEWIALAILDGCSKYQIDPLLATALFTQESGFNMAAISRTGAIGIAQLMPDTAQALGVDPYDMDQNIEGGIKYLANQIRSFGTAGDWSSSFAIAAYNAGPGAVKQYGGIPPYDETINHVQCVGAIFSRLLNEYASV